MLNRSARLLVLLTLNTSAAVLAAGDPQSPSGIVITDTQDETVVVTARRREEQVQDVPIAVAAVSGTSLQQTGSNNVAVAILDTGFDYNHVDLSANIYNNPGECTGDGVDNDSNGYIDDCHGINVAYGTSDPMDDNDHGTHVAGTIGAVGNNGIGVVGVKFHAQAA